MAEIDLDGVRAYRAEPPATARGGIVLIHEIWGLVPHITDVADASPRRVTWWSHPDLLSEVGITPGGGNRAADDAL